MLTEATAALRRSKALIGKWKISCEEFRVVLRMPGIQNSKKHCPVVVLHERAGVTHDCILDPCFCLSTYYTSKVLILVVNSVLFWESSSVTCVYDLPIWK